MATLERFDPLGIVLGSSDETELDDFQKYVEAMGKALG
jgi:hypothetical protein